VFAAVKLQLGVLRERLDPSLARQVADTVELVDTGMRSVRRVTDELRPRLLDDLGLLPALRSLCEAFAERAGIPVILDAPASLPHVSGHAELALFRAMQEALANIARHAEARQVAVRLTNGDGHLVLEIQDDGRGLSRDFDLERAEQEGHLGLAGMRERIAALGGAFQLSGAPGAGVRLRLDVPLEETEAT
jgi:signal transduction histidine kinase